MFQKFFTDTIMSRFIKGLLSTTNIPLYRFVKEGDFLIGPSTPPSTLDPIGSDDGQIYIYDHWIIKCTSTGTLALDKLTTLYPSYELYPKADLYPGGGGVQAGFKVLSHYNEDDYNKYNYRYNSSISYYDSLTHKHLGNYLRYLRDKKDLNLFPYYNCYNYHMIDSLSLGVSSGKDVESKGIVYWESSALQDYKLLAIPIKFNESYTIALECPSRVIMRAVIYGPMGMMVKYPGVYYSDSLNNTGVVYNSTTFKNPILYSVLTEDVSVLKREEYLYLLIQIPTDNSSSVVVLEGNYTTKLTEVQALKNKKAKFIYNAGSSIDINNNLYPAGHKPNITIPYKNSDLSLLSINTQETYAFSNRLIEYLLGTVINKNEPLSRNIEKLQHVLHEVDSDYKDLLIGNGATYGVWDSYINSSIDSIIQNQNYTSISNDTQLTVHEVPIYKEVHIIDAQGQIHLNTPLNICQSLNECLDLINHPDQNINHNLGYLSQSINLVLNEDQVENGCALLLGDNRTIQFFENTFHDGFYGENASSLSETLEGKRIQIYYSSEVSNNTKSRSVNKKISSNPNAAGIYFWDMDSNVNLDIEKYFERIGGFTLDE